jgi:oligopeptide/dipeptide ABC transporter ATP-binding protein
VIELLEEVQQESGIACLFISHDLSVVHHISDRVAVMYLGRIVEIGAAQPVVTRPKHPYSAALLSAVPVPDPVLQHKRRRIILTGDLPSPSKIPSGCRFRTRCPFAMDVCREVDPEPYVAPDGVEVRCHLHTTGPVLAGETVMSLIPPDGNAPSRPG